MSSAQRILSLLLLATASTMLAGCKSLDLNDPKWFPWASDKPVEPAKVIAMWSDTVLNQPGQVPKRGFGGRIMFYGPKSEKPVKVEGTLTVYAFDEDGRDPNNLKADRKFVFTKDQFAKHYSKSKLGPSYSVWIPWDNVEGPRKQLSMIVRFTPEKGAPVVGEQTRHVLPGQQLQTADNAPGPSAPPAVNISLPTAAGGLPAGDPSAASIQGQANGVRLASHDANIPGAEQLGTVQRRMITTTIAAPSAVARPSCYSPSQPTAAGAAAAAPPSAGARAPASATPTGTTQAPSSSLPMWPMTRTQGWTPSQPQAGYQPARSRVPGEPAGPLVRDRGLLPPSPAASQYPAALPPSSAPGPSGPGALPSAGSLPY